MNDKNKVLKTSMVINNKEGELGYHIVDLLYYSKLLPLWA